MTNETRFVLCGEASGDQLDAPDVLRLRNMEPERNVNLHIDDISRSLYRDVQPHFEDLVEIATFIYVADQATTRGGDGVDNMGEEWRRPLHFEIPVRCLDLWRKPETVEALQQAVSFLSEDRYTFVFREYNYPPAFQRCINFAQFDWAYKPQSVVLFSGGLDSLGGAVQEVVVAGSPVALVTHQSNAKFINRLRMLRQMLDGRAKGVKPLHITVGINKDKDLNHEYTQRSRSFLYATLGATIAQMCDLDEVRFYENGTVSLNLPISRQVVGSKATRTTHPKTLAGFERLFSLLAQRPISVPNGFLWKTKGEVVRLIMDAGCGGMIEWSTSCTHTWETSNAQPHCGKCSQCIDRRFAVLAAGAGPFERADTYGVDLMIQPRDKGEPRTMLASYVETAQQVATISEMEFFMRFGEVGRIVRQLGGSADANARKVYDLYRRHAAEVVRVVEQELAAHAPKVLARSLPESCLLRLVHDPSASPEWSGRSGNPVQSLASEPDYFLRQRGEGWQIRFAGHETQWLKPAIGYAYLRELLQYPNRRFSLCQLLVAVHGDMAVLPLGDGGKDFDSQAKKAYALRLQEIDQELDEAREMNDTGRSDKLGSERARLLEQVKQAGFRGSAKRSNSDLNNIRNSVCNAIKRALITIKKYEPAAFTHLKTSITTGFTVIYQPCESVPWSV
jgi:hypothetical protein